jgi:hypothetical protein
VAAARAPGVVRGLGLGGGVRPAAVVAVMHTTMLAVAKGRGAPRGLLREKDDFYRTPEMATAALLGAEPLGDTVWEPACGDGAICRPLEAAGVRCVATDLVDRGYGAARRDFLFERELLAPVIVTNPPFKLADEFALHALGLGAQKVCLFMRLAWLEGGARCRSLWRPHPPARVWVFARRVPQWRAADPSPENKGGAIPFAWFVWERGHTGGPTLGWIA